MPVGRPRTRGRAPARVSVRGTMGAILRGMDARSAADELSPEAARDLAARRHRRAEKARRERMRKRRLATSVTVGLVLIAAIGAGAWWWLSRPPLPVRRVAAGAAAAEAGVSLAAAQTATATAPMAAWAVAERKRLAGPPPLTPAPGVRTIVVDKSEQKVTLYEADGRAVDRFICSTGHTYPRVGTYKVTSRKEVSWYPKDGSRFEHFVIFTKADTGTNIGFHSQPTKNGEVQGTLGLPESHGCVRLAEEKAEFVFTWAKNGTKVVVQK